MRQRPSQKTYKQILKKRLPVKKLDLLKKKIVMHIVQNKKVAYGLLFICIKIELTYTALAAHQFKKEIKILSIRWFIFILRDAV